MAPARNVPKIVAKFIVSELEEEFRIRDTLVIHSMEVAAV
jgi:hypothetical protein